MYCAMTWHVSNVLALERHERMKVPAAYVCHSRSSGTDSRVARPLQNSHSSTISDSDAQGVGRRLHFETHLAYEQRQRGHMVVTHPRGTASTKTPATEPCTSSGHKEPSSPSIQHVSQLMSCADQHHPSSARTVPNMLSARFRALSHMLSASAHSRA
jgi:hypothetical protein